MKSSKDLKSIMILGIAAVVGIIYRAEIAGLLRSGIALLAAAPCSRPIPYSIGEFDARFGITRGQFISDIATAEGIWEASAGKPLFAYSEAGKLKVNLMYDYRQKATADMQKIDTAIKGDKATYDALKAKLDPLKATYGAQKASFQAEFSAHEAAAQAYSSEVAYWNSKGGAPRSEYAKLEQKRQELNTDADRINADQKSLNAAADTLNGYVNQINSLAAKLNLSVENYNAVGASTGGEFEEGEYVEDSSGKRINIYQFGSNAKLVRVLAHELGHALGLDHVDDPKAIMYRLNQGVNEKLTASDIAELDVLCKIER